MTVDDGACERAASVEVHLFSVRVLVQRSVVMLFAAIVLFASAAAAQLVDDEDERDERLCVAQALSTPTVFPFACRNMVTVDAPPRCKGPTCVVDITFCCNSGNLIYATWLRGPDGALVEIEGGTLMAPAAVAFDASGRFVHDGNAHRWTPPPPDASASAPSPPSDKQKQQAIAACRRHAPTCAASFTTVADGSCGSQGCLLLVSDGEGDVGAFCIVWVPRRGPARVVNAGDDLEPPVAVGVSPPNGLGMLWPDGKGRQRHESFFAFGGALRREAWGVEVPFVDVNTWQQVLKRERSRIVPFETTGITSMISGEMSWSGDNDIDMLARVVVGDDVFAFEALVSDDVIVFPGGGVAPVAADHLELLSGRSLIAFVPRDARRVDVERWRNADGFEVREPVPEARCTIRAARATDDTAPYQPSSMNEPKAQQTVRVLTCVVPRVLLGADPTKEALSLRVSDGDGAGQKTLSAVPIGPLRPQAIFPPVAELPATGSCRPQ